MALTKADWDELRRAKKEVRAEERQAARELRAFEDGRTAALAGEPEESCRCIKGNYRNHWLRGHRDGLRILEEHAARRALTDEERRHYQFHWAALRAALKP
jgi:ribosome modulation factor